MCGKLYRDWQESQIACYLDLLYNCYPPNWGAELSLERGKVCKNFNVQSDYCWVQDVLGPYNEVIVVYKPEPKEASSCILRAMYRDGDGICM